MQRLGFKQLLQAHSQPVPMTPRFHLFPFRTQKLSLVVPKILGWRRPGKIGRCRLFSLFGEKPAFSPKYGPLVKRLRRRPLTAKTGVRFPYRLFILKGLSVQANLFLFHKRNVCFCWMECFYLQSINFSVNIFIFFIKEALLWLFLTP